MVGHALQGERGRVDSMKQLRQTSPATPVVTICIYDVRKFSGVKYEYLKGHRDILRYPLEQVLA